MFDPNAWAWPQWSMAAILFLGITFASALHGKPKVNRDGTPECHSFPLALTRTAFWGFFLLYGGFFAGRA
jgi:hypothetical protein